MCDFAADAEAARQLLVGRVLTVERVRQLNANDYFYQMLKDNPEMLKIYPGIENKLLEAAIDFHIHAFPDFVYRSRDMIQMPSMHPKPACALSRSKITGTSVATPPIWRSASRKTRFE
jgi:hypothetical protein